jgi:hypothetical protein
MDGSLTTNVRIRNLDTVTGVALENPEISDIPAVHSPVILLDYVVEVFARANTNIDRQDGRLF